MTVPDNPTILASEIILNSYSFTGVFQDDFSGPSINTANWRIEDMAR